MSKETGAAVIAILVVASFGIGYLTGNITRNTESITSTVASVTTSTLTTQRTVTSTATSTSTVAAPVVPSDAATAVGSNGSSGLDLVLAVNATTLKVGETLNVEVSLFNARPSVNVVNTSMDWPWGSPGRDNFSGLPVIFGGPCGDDPFVRAVVIPGTYTTQELPAAANSSLEWQCSEGPVWTSATFQPESSLANVTANHGPGADVTSPPHDMTIKFTTNGYWDLTNFSKLLNQPLICLQFCTNTPTATKFVPGVYTVAVSDEWGSEAILHVTVNG
jgi:hypothetical protein